MSIRVLEIMVNLDRYIVCLLPSIINACSCIRRCHSYTWSHIMLTLIIKLNSTKAQMLLLWFILSDITFILTVATILLCLRWLGFRLFTLRMSNCAVAVLVDTLYFYITCIIFSFSLWFHFLFSLLKYCFNLEQTDNQWLQMKRFLPYRPRKQILAQNAKPSQTSHLQSQLRQQVWRAMLQEYCQQRLLMLQHSCSLWVIWWRENRKSTREISRIRFPFQVFICIAFLFSETAFNNKC